MSQDGLLDLFDTAFIPMVNKFEGDPVSQYIWYPRNIYPRILILVPPTKYPRNFDTHIPNFLGTLVPPTKYSRNLDTPILNILGTLVFQASQLATMNYCFCKNCSANVQEQMTHQHSLCIKNHTSHCSHLIIFCLDIMLLYACKLLLLQES